ncbi:MAG: hypothetical protein OXC10_06730 [Rhodospirillaceae bacterium]|nr:hypothetical protein [Rhodospirillaceae bacterium]
MPIHRRHYFFFGGGGGGGGLTAVGGLGVTPLFSGTPVEVGGTFLSTISISFSAAAAAAAV